MQKTWDEIRRRMNAWGASGEPFLLLVDFERQSPRLWRLGEVDSSFLRYDFHGRRNYTPSGNSPSASLRMRKEPVAFKDYLAAFERVQTGLRRGDSFLVNLTFPTPIDLNWSLLDVFEQTQARYRLWWDEQWVFFSPEIFVQIKDGRIYSFPMKGTLPAHLPGELLLENEKERAEHATIVDLIRNDLSQVARQVRVERYRYLERLTTHRGNLWQTSSRIAGDLPPAYAAHLGDLLLRLLPAGSISGAPKASTLEIIRRAELEKRGYYTGIAALWDGRELDSCVLIRCVENTRSGKRYWSGGGITAYSNAEEEYEEMKEKVYLPIRTEANLFNT